MSRFVMLAFFLGSVIGDSTGYWTGRWMGKTLFNRGIVVDIQAEPC